MNEAQELIEEEARREEADTKYILPEGEVKCDYCGKMVDMYSTKKTKQGYVACDECYTSEELIQRCL